MLLGGFIRRARKTILRSTTIGALIGALCMVGSFIPSASLAAEGAAPDTVSQSQHFPQDTEAILGELIDLISIDYKAIWVSDQGKAHNRFHSLLAGLGQRLGDSTITGSGEAVETDIRRSLIAMTVDRARNPTYYDELTRWYGVWGATHKLDGTEQILTPRWGLEPRPLLAKHATEGYRLTWESLWVGPPFRDTWLMARRRGPFSESDLRVPRIPRDIRLQALAKTGNTASIPVVLHRIRLGTQKVDPGIIDALAYFCTEEALRGILECLSMWDPSPTDKPVPITERRWYRDVLFTLTDPLNRGESQDEKDRLLRVEQWREVIERFPKDDLPPDQRELLEQVLAFERETDEAPEAP